MTATGSRPGSSLTCATVNAADSTRETSTRASPLDVAPAEWLPVISPTPASEIANPAQASGRATVRCQSAASTATSTGTAPISSAASLTLVRAMPAFCSMTDPPYPIAPEASTDGLRAGFSRARATGSSTAAASANLARASQAGGSQSSASLDSGTVVPQSSPAAVRARNADADRTNVELARVAGLSPAATLHRVRWLKESGVIRIIAAQLDPAAVGFPLQVYVMATLARHDPRSSRIFEYQVRAHPQIVAADNVAGEMDYLLTVVARDVADLQEVLASLAARGGQRLVTHLRLAEVKPPSRLPLEAGGPAQARRTRRRGAGEPR